MMHNETMQMMPRIEQAAALGAGLLMAYAGYSLVGLDSAWGIALLVYGLVVAAYTAWNAVTLGGFEHDLDRELATARSDAEKAYKAL